MSADLKLMAAQAAVDKMFADGYFCICTVDKIADMLGLQVRGSEAYPILRTLHCVRFDKMQAELAAQIPVLLAQLFEGGINLRFQFSRPPGQLTQVIEVKADQYEEHPKARISFLRLLSKGGKA